MIIILGLAVSGIFAVLGLLHVFWLIRGSSAGSSVVPTVGGKRTFEPTPAQTVAVAIALLLASATVLGQIGVLTILPPWVYRTGTFVLACVFGGRAIGNFKTVGFFKRVSDSAFARWDSKLYSPLCAALSFSCFLVAIFASAT